MGAIKKSPKDYIKTPNYHGKRQTPWPRWRQTSIRKQKEIIKK
jgi:hypothetical protein